MNKSEFYSALHLHTPHLDSEVLLWAWKAGLFENPAELERCRLQKINWFAGYLFPKEEPEMLELIMKFFLCLFLLDDLLDKDPNSGSIDFLERLKLKKSFTGDARLQVLGSNLLHVHKLIEKPVSSVCWSELWQKSWEEYVVGLQWELRNKANRVRPYLEEYRYYRPFVSGVFLATTLLRNDTHLDDCESATLENFVARFICLSNDQASFEKEKSIGDFHNELILMEEALGDAVQLWAHNEIQSIQLKIFEFVQQDRSTSANCQQWFESLFLMVGGCLAWSAETSRYVNYINGSVSSD
ncbi:terpene synthase family protein [Algoriphagus antarcticus]|uniref:Terpene synthase n=1 Tax=Algoriphagus antarcticus TaxID=238540 RepID=A0A3E0D7H0_9BACT|nr:terpene synthase family protein [Algoriphagus antarcticus]REG77518.1 hypothetical protein C8N25_14318 [Algoriphagus antarcticus]